MKDKWIKAPQSIIDFLYKRAYKCRIEVVILYIILSIVISGVSVCVIFNFIATINNSDIDVLELIKRILFSVAIISLSIWITKTCIKEYKVFRATTKEMKEGRCYIGKTNIVKTDSKNHTRYVIIDILDEDGNMLKEERYKLVDNYNESRADDEIIIFKAKCWEKELIILKDSEINRLQYKLDKIF